MLDNRLAELYEVPTFRLNEAVKRNRRRFPKDFMFRLTAKETTRDCCEHRHHAHVRALRQILSTHKDLAQRLAAMEKKYDKQFKVVFDILRQLMEPLPDAPKHPIGVVASKNQ
jgi:hypothetical protein